MTKIYEQFDKAFANVSAYLVLDKSGECVAKIVFKFPRDGAGRLYAYVHWLGVEMVRGHAGGYGYDKRSAAVASAATELYRRHGSEPDEARAAFITKLMNDGGEYWDRRLCNAGFNVIQAV